MKMKLIAAVALLMLASLLAGCNTLHGIGKDIEKGGEAIQKSTR